MRLRQLLIPALVSTSVALTTGCSSNPPRGQIAQDTAEIHRGLAQLDRDTKEVQTFRAKLNQLNFIDPDVDGKVFRAVASDMFSDMEREVDQAKRKTKQAAAELGRARREARKETKEAAITGTKRDRREARDDRRDAADDRRDLATAAGREHRMKEIFDECKGLRWGVARGDEKAIRRGKNLLGQFLAVMEADLAATEREIAEDRRERREDLVQQRR